MHHFGLSISQIFDGKSHGTLHAVQVIIDAQPLQHKERGRHTAQPQFGGKVLLKEILNQLNALLRAAHVEQGMITFGLNQFTHIFYI